MISNYILITNSTYFPNPLNLVIPKKSSNVEISKILSRNTRCTINSIVKITGRSTILRILPSSSFNKITRSLSTIKIEAQFLFHKSKLAPFKIDVLDWWTRKREHWRTTLAASRSGWPSTWNCRGCSAGETRVLWPVSRLLHAGTRRRRRNKRRMKIDGERLSALFCGAP